jgi:hypothetical protein
MFESGLLALVHDFSAASCSCPNCCLLHLLLAVSPRPLAALVPAAVFASPSQVLYILMNGTGVGFSVEPVFVEQLPTVAERFVQTSSTVVVEDSREGWARALREIIALLYTGHVS